MSTKKLQILGSFGSSDADTLDGKHADEFVVITDDPVYALEDGEDIYAESINADTLQGHPASDFATPNFVVAKIAEAQLGGDNSDIDLSGYATKDELNKLTAEDVGAVSIHGGSVMLGNIDMNGKVIYNVPKPNGWGDVANKGYVDDALNNLTADDVDALPIGGGAMNGALNMNSQPLWGLANPTGYDQPVTYRMHLDDLATKAANIGKGAYTGDVNIVGDNGVPANSALWVSQAANLPSGHQWGVLETWQPQAGSILQRFSSSDGGVFWREYFHNDVSEDWHIGWQRLDNKECAPAGFGLGGGGVYISDCNTALESGFYKWDINCANSPFDYATMIVSGRHGDCCNQIAICNAGGDRGKIVARAVDGSGASPWIPLDGRNSAPAGYGLGEAVPRQVSSLDEVTSAGWYKKWFEPSELPPGATNGTKSFRVGNFYDVDNLEIILPVNNSWTDFTVLTNLRKRKSGGDWLDWEWENPNMDSGIEYRTTERYQGKPVYAKMFTTGAMTNGTWMTYAPDATKAIRCSVTDTGSSVLLPRYAGGALSGGTYSLWYDVHGKEFCAYHGSGYSAVQYDVQIWYVK